MKRYFYTAIIAVSLSMTGCVNTIHHNESLDDSWIQQQVEQGNEIPNVLK